MDIHLHFIAQGSGQPLILLHGNGESTECFSHQLEPFSQHCRVIAVDTRGHGLSPRGDAPFTISQFAEDLKDFLEQQKIEKASILGFSDGGNIALCFAARYPERVDRLIVDGANLTPWGLKTKFLLWLLPAYVRARHQKGTEAEKQAELLRLMVKDPMLTGRDLSAISAKTLVMAGTEDLIRASHTKKICRLIKGAQLQWIPGDHAIANTNPAAFNRAVLEFLEETE